ADPHPAHRPHPRAGVCGAVVFISAAAGAAMAGAPVGPPSPAPAVPDLVAVVYAHDDTAAVDPTATTGGRRPADPTIRPAADGCDHPWQVGPWLPSWSPTQHADAVRHARAAIAAGDIYQVNLVGHAAADYTGDPLPALARL